MKIIVDKEWNEVMKNLLNLALQTNWIKELDWVNKIISSIEDYKEPVIDEAKEHYKEGIKGDTKEG